MGQTQLLNRHDSRVTQTNKAKFKKMKRRKLQMMNKIVHNPGLSHLALDIWSHLEVVPDLINCRLVCNAKNLPKSSGSSSSLKNICGKTSGLHITPRRCLRGVPFTGTPKMAELKRSFSF